jgi:adenylate cyclase
MLTSAARWAGLAAASILANAGLAILLFRMRKRNERLSVAREKATLDLQNLQQAFHQFAPQRVVEDVIKRGVSTSGEVREVTVLFADIVAFTALCETLSPETLVRMLNGYFDGGIDLSNVAQVVRAGVEIVVAGSAIFGAPESNAWHSMDAVVAALSMREAIAVFNQELQKQNLPPLDVRVGVHKGKVVAGVVGSSENLEYTVIGDVVNTAARIESLTRKHAVDILISADVRPALDGRFKLRQLPPEYVKGRLIPSSPSPSRPFEANKQP